MQILSGLCGKLFIVKAKLKNENQKMIGWHAGCKRKGRGGGAKFPQREFARDGQFQTAAIHSHKSAAHRAGRQTCGSGGADTTRGSDVSDTLEVC